MNRALDPVHYQTFLFLCQNPVYTIAGAAI